MSTAPNIALAITGASGIQYGIRLLECLLAAGCHVNMMYSDSARIVALEEMELVLSENRSETLSVFEKRFNAQPGQLRIYGIQDWFSPLASGSNPPDAYVICPCSMASVAKIAAGMADDLITRVADVVLKERRKLVLVPRESPFSSIHLENLLRLSQAGAVILPPSPGFYHRPTQISDLIDFVVARILDQLGVQHSLIRRWGS